MMVLTSSPSRLASADEHVANDIAKVVEPDRSARRVGEGDLVQAFGEGRAVVGLAVEQPLDVREAFPTQTQTWPHVAARFVITIKPSVGRPAPSASRQHPLDLERLNFKRTSCAFELRSAVPSLRRAIAPEGNA
jgi:hypothetical protein